ncbi:hypothetical protein VNO80_27575 [Phaseolus coccineus]|uniref:Protein BIC1 n=1 Tax=Phaseolus coccineus TaxID=3886 RepID=A0AAN9LLI1_PHACN
MYYKTPTQCHSLLTLSFLSLTLLPSATTLHLSMEGNSFSHNMPACCSTKLIISPSSTSFSLEPNEMLKNNTRECKSSDARDNDDKVKDQEEGHSENIGEVGVEETGREKLKRLREEVMMEKINIPEDWGQERKLKDWIDCTMFDAFLAPHSLIVSARDALCMQSKVTKIK